MLIDRDPLCRIDEVARHFGVSISTVRHWMREGRFPAGSVLKIGRTYRFKLHTIEKVFLEQPDTPEEEAPAPAYEGEIVEQLNLDFSEDGEQQ